MDVVKYLVEHGADVNKENRIGKTPLSSARISRSSDVVKYLEEHGAHNPKFFCDFSVYRSIGV